MSTPNDELAAIFEAALALETGTQRADYLSRACPNAELRREVESLLGAHDHPDSMFEGETIRVEVAPSEEVGAGIGRYKLLENLGEGGFGAVWLAEQKEPVRRKVALKVIKLGMDTKQVVARFEAERQALALMDHPNIAKVLDAGTTEQGRPYFVMELVRGIPITAFCDQNKLATGERLGLFIKVCQAVQHAHQKGIIHRDLKPSNVLVTLHDGVPVPKVIDFGIAKATQQELTDKTIHTLFQQFIGTPAYVSPEQAEMSGLDIDTRSDIYSLGVLLYELLTGVTPFDGKELLMSGLDEMRRTIREKEPPRPSTRLTQLPLRRSSKSEIRNPKSDIDHDLDWIVMKCLEKDRARRYETANGLAADLKRYLNNEPVVACPPSAAYRFRKLVRRNKLAFAAAGAVTAALIAGLAVALVALSQESQARRLALAAQTEADAQRRQAQASARLAEGSRQRAEDARKTTGLNLYAADVLTAQQHLAHGNLGAAQNVLDAHHAQDGEDNRGWEWRYLREQAEGARPRRLEGHTAAVNRLRFSPDGRQLAASGGDFRLWDVDQAGRFRRWDRPEKVHSFDFARDGRLGVVTASGNLLLLEPDTLRVVKSFDLPGAESVMFSPVTNAAAVRVGEELALWLDLDSGVSRPLFGGELVHLTDVSDDGTLVCGRTARDVVVWNLVDGAEVLRAPAPRGAGWKLDLKFLPDRGELLLTSMEREPVVLATQESEWRWEFPFAARDAGVNELAVSQTGGFIVASSYNHEVVLWNLSDFTPRVRFHGHRDEAWCVAVSPDGRRVASGGQDRLILLWDSRWQPREERLEGNFHVIEPVFSHDGRRLALPGPDNRVEVWDLRDQHLLQRLPSGSVPLAFTKDDGRLLVFTETELLRWDTVTWQPAGSQPLGFVADMNLDFPWGGPLVGVGGEILALADTHRVVHLLDLPAGKEHATVALGPRTQNLALSPDAHWLGMGDAGGGIHLWDLAGGIPVERDSHQAHERDIVHLSFSPDSRLLATFSHDSLVKIWSVAPLKLLHELRGHKRGLAGGGFSPDGRTLASVDHVRMLLLWHVATGRELAAFEPASPAELDQHLAQAAFSPDGRYLMAWRWKGPCQYWHAPLFDELELAAPAPGRVTPP